jgi:deoxyribodipyrimidine photo-lyase
VAANGINFALALAENIPDIILFIGEFNALLSHISPEHIHYKEHPLNSHYKGTVTARAWLSNVTGYYPSFFAFWKKCKKELRK